MLISAVEFFFNSSGDLFFLMNEKDESINLRVTSWPNKTHSNFLLFMGLYSKLRVKAGRGRGGQITRGNSYTYLKETVS